MPELGQVFETDVDGKWLIQGKARLLVEPSQAWLDARAAENAAREPTPDPAGLLRAILGVVGLDRGNEMLSRWPSFARALDAGNWPVAEATLTIARQSNSITESELQLILGLMVEYHIPLTNV